MSTWIIAAFVPDDDGGRIEYAGKVFRVSGSHEAEIARLTADLRAVSMVARSVSGTLKLRDHRGVPKDEYRVVMRDLADVLDDVLACPGVQAVLSQSKL